MNTEDLPYLPSPTQHLLMKAALLDRAPALQAWQDWKASVDLADIDHPSLRMLPMLYHNLRRHDAPEDADLLRLKGVYRLTWVQNQLLLRRLPEVLAQLKAHGIECMILKGAAMVFGYYHDYGIRPMHDLDLLVPPDQGHLVGDSLADIGWRRQHQYPKALLKFRRELVFVNDADQEIDAHWFLLREWCQAEQTQELWANTMTVPREEGPVTTLNPTFMLLHTCGHGYQWGDLPNFIWIADAHKIITGASNRIDWEKLVAAANSYDLTLPLRNLLTYLSDELDTAIPSRVLEQLRQTLPSRRDVSIHDARAASPNTVNRVLRKHWFYYSAVQQREGKRRNPFGFMYYFCLHFQDFWELRYWWYVPFHGLKAMRQQRST